eukprot:scaffold66816_cov19-Tisochrysis_lutea.AAC.1
MRLHSSIICDAALLYQAMYSCNYLPSHAGLHSAIKSCKACTQLPSHARLHSAVKPCKTAAASQNHLPMAQTICCQHLALIRSRA